MSDIKVVITIDEEDIPFTIDEAREIYNQLDKIFGKKEETTSPLTIPLDPFKPIDSDPWMPGNPWTSPITYYDDVHSVSNSGTVSITLDGEPVESHGNITLKAVT